MPRSPATNYSQLVTHRQLLRFRKSGIEVSEDTASQLLAVDTQPPISSGTDADELPKQTVQERYHQGQRRVVYRARRNLGLSWRWQKPTTSTVPTFNAAAVMYQRRGKTDTRRP
jgi:hypothetical protein